MEIVEGDIAWYSAGYCIAPVAIIVPWPTINLGTEKTVPIVPGFVSVIVVPVNSDGSIVPFLELATRFSYDSRN